MRSLFLIILIFCLPINAQENVTQASEVSAIALLNEARSLKATEHKMSAKLANEALSISKQNNHYDVSAQAHVLLGELALESKSIVQSMEHFLQVSLIYKEMNDERYAEADRAIDDLLPIAQENKVAGPIALLFIAQGDGDYKQKRFSDAIVHYSHALKYLLDPDKAIQKKRGETYKKIAQSYKRLKNREQTAAFYKKALETFTVLQDKKNMARTLNTLAEAERYLDDYVTALDYSTRGLQIHKEIDDPEGYAKALTGAGIIYRYIGRYEKSLNHIYEAHRYYKKVDNVSGIAKTSNQMGLIYTRLKQFEQARSFYQLTIDLPQEKIEPKTRASALREMAVINLNSGDYQSAKVMIIKAHKIYQNNNSKTKQSLTARIIGNIYRAESDYVRAIAYYRESLSIATEVGSKLYQVKALTPLAAMLFNENIDESVELLKKSLLLAEQMDSNSAKLYAYRELRKAEKLRGNYQASIGYAEKELFFTGVIQKERDDNDLAMVKAKLYSHKIEMELESLREKAKRNQLEMAKKNHEIEIAEKIRTITDLELTKNKYASFALASLSLLCVLALIFIYWRFVNSRKLNRELDYLATRDPLTNCYNRRVLFERMDQDFGATEALEDYCVIMADIDHFKAINDTYGHTSGDAVICSVVNILQNSVRKSDLVTRYGGEEFCIVLYRIPKSEVLSIAESMRHKMENARFDDIAITCSFGVTSIEFNAKTPEEIINQADLALYKSKSLGRNQVTMWHETFEKRN